MVTVYSPVCDMRPEEYRRVIEVTYLGYVHGTLAALKHMRKARAGTIVQVGSALAYRAIPLQSAYCAAKFAVRGFTDSLRSELISERMPIRLTMVQLPAINTPQFTWARNHLSRRPRPVAPIFSPEAAARAIYALAERRTAPREVWLGRSVLAAIVGNVLAPGLLDRYLAATAMQGQQTDEPATPNQPDNLLTPVLRDFGAEGRFGAEAQPRVRAINPAALRWTLLVALLALITARGVNLATARLAERREP